MNRRFVDLAKQAGLQSIPSSNSGPLRVEYLTPEMEKFAELIVGECMQVANEYQNRGGNCYVDNMIAKHFGVEE